MWNPVVNFFLEVKEDAIMNMYDIWGYDKSKTTCLEYWASHSAKRMKEFCEIIEPLQLNEYEDYLLIRYGNYSDIYGGEENVTPEEFWNKYNGLYKECRSLVIDIKNDQIVLAPFKKFCNLNEVSETSLENVQNKLSIAKTVEFSNKLDGSMCSASWHHGNIVLSTSQALDRNRSFRLDECYEMFYAVPGYQKMIEDYPWYTFIFEYISLKDQHVVRYTEEQQGLYLIGIRDKYSGKQLSYAECKQFSKEYQIPVTDLFETTFDEVLNNLDSKRSVEAEGFVINIDSNLWIKIKYTDYVAMHHILSSLSSPNMIIRAIADNTWDDFYSKVPDAYKDKVWGIALHIFEYSKSKSKDIDEYYDKIVNMPLKDAMIYVSNSVPKFYQGYVRAKYLNQPYNLLKGKNGNYKKYKEIITNDKAS